MCGCEIKRQRERESGGGGGGGGASSWREHMYIGQAGAEQSFSFKVHVRSTWALRATNGRTIFIQPKYHPSDVFFSSLFSNPSLVFHSVFLHHL